MIGHHRLAARGGAHVAAVAALVFLLGGCGRGDSTEGGAEAGSQPQASRESAEVRSACDVLTGEDVSAILGQTLHARPEADEQGPTYSGCGYYPDEGYGVLYLTVYWEGGRDGWDSWMMATSWAGKAWEETEKVDLDSITGASLVSGLGDRAYFGGILPSLVLKGDVLMEFKLALVTEEETSFPLLAKAALAHLD